MESNSNVHLINNLIGKLKLKCEVMKLHKSDSEKMLNDIDKAKAILMRLRQLINEEV